MPKLMDKNAMQTHQTLHNFNFSAVDIKSLGASEYTIVTIVQDTSSSVTAFKDEMEKTLKQILDSCKKAPRSGNLLLRLAEFNNNLNELHGFRELNSINPDEYDNILNCRGMTALKDATLSCIEATEVYGKQLVAMDYSFNTVLVGVGNDPAIQSLLKQFKDEAGLDQYVNMGDATPNNLAKLAAFVSKSISSTSQALGTGSPSQPLTF